MRSHKLERVSSIIMFLLTQEQISMTKLAKIIGTSTLVIHRDIENILNAGLPLEIKAGVKGGVSIGEDFKKNNVSLLSADSSSVMLALFDMYPKLLEIDASYIIAKREKSKADRKNNSAELVSVKIRFHESHMGYINRHYAFSDIIYNKDKYCVAHIKIHDNEHEYNKLLILGNKFKCLEPQYISDYIRNKIDEIKKLYDEISL